MSWTPGLLEHDYQKWSSERLVSRLETLRLQANARLRRHRAKRKAARLAAQHVDDQALCDAPKPKSTHKRIK